MEKGIFPLFLLLALAIVLLCLLSVFISIIRQVFSAWLYCPYCGRKLSDNNSGLEEVPENICAQCHHDLGSRSPFRFWQIARWAAFIRNGIGQV